MGRFDDFDNIEKTRKDLEAFKKLKKLSSNDLNKLGKGIDEAIEGIKAQKEAKDTSFRESALRGGFDEETRKKFAKKGFSGNVFSTTEFTVGEGNKKEFVSRKKTNPFNIMDFDMNPMPKKLRKEKKKSKSKGFDFMGGF